jgi:hypothetical protein
MKTLTAACFSFALLFCSLCQGTEYVSLLIPPSPVEPPYLNYSENLVLAAGDSATLVYAPYDFFGNIRNLALEVQIGAYTFDLAWPTYEYAAHLGPAIAGPAILRMRQEGAGFPQPRVTTFSVTRANTAANVIPANAVVIPEDAGGQYQVILESSTDLLNWAVTNPGTYGGNTPGRFFRTRIVKLN